MVIAIIEIIVDDDDRPIVPTQRRPTDIIMPPIPVHPGRTPMASGNPVPAQTEPPVPPSVMINTPAPGLVRNPGPAAGWIPEPSPVIIGSPV